ncbi:MAG: hypothetical protein MRY57_00505 [Candidatus Pacebacteria bacterium]|nr:hypothetical protein [Candidatus Paceibacterota bacterium]
MLKKRIRILVDMDGVLADFFGRRNQMLKNNPGIKFPQSQYRFFAELEPIKDAIEVFLFLSLHFDVHILTAPSIKNLLCYTEKAEWVLNNLGEEALSNMSISPNKDFFKGDYLIDDNDSGKGQDKFEGKLIHFHSKTNNWQDIKKYFIDTYPEHIQKTA